ncbi:Cytoskeleton assembly control protein, putative [Candida maltosa Xu316]|uniref:Actin cytoskeleton-regulatory complex protein SLA1 n=1 Tax=Candida maltosa (strain Xu316) TaxID=1245528 RepID=M3IWE8_CANMX|nr:Cytoskeleton assembly control protein, putative [Candida maltosa Xu316]
MSSIYIGVYKALYDYAAQADEELNISENDLLYLLEKSEIDDWWKVKKRVIASGDEVVDEPSGLVPSTYIEEAPVIKTATALYDYDKQTDEELSFSENEKFNVYDLNDPDWILVGDLSKQRFGFVPSNYIQIDSDTAAAPAQQQAYQPPPVQQQQQQPQQQQQAPLPISNFLPPPVHKDRTPDFPPPPVHKDRTPENQGPPTPEKDYPRQLEHRESRTSNHRYQDIGDDEEAPPPPMPTRPTQEASSSSAAAADNYEREENVDQDNGHSYDGEFFTWYIDEVDGRKKRAIKLSIGQGLIIIKPNTNNPKKLRLRSSSSLDNQWRVRDLLNFSHEKKHVFLEFKNPATSLELHAGSKDVAEAIMAILGDLKGAESAHGLKEVAKASQASTNGNNKKIGRLLYDFEAQGEDELNSKEGDEVYIINEKKSKDWWMVQNVDTGRQGVVPSSYIEIVGTSNLDKLTDGPLRRKSTRSKGRVVEGKDKRHEHHSRGRAERDRIREKDRMQRDKAATSSSNDAHHDKSMPNYHRVRTWIDSSGTFKVEAEFLGCVEGKIHLHKTNGVKIAVAADKLSVEDLEYVERVTGTSLEQYKEQVIRQQEKRARSKSKSGAKHEISSPTEPRRSTSATGIINDIPPPKPSRSKATTHVSGNNAPLYDWFDFFLECGVEIGNCQRYTLNFEREQMDENILEDISPSLLRTLGLREGDIIRVMKFLDNKFDRKRGSEEPQPTGGLFVDSNGALKNNSSTSEVSKVTAGALPSPIKVQASTPVPELNNQTNKIEDDAWAMKPAARSSEDLLKTNSQPQTPQYTGALSDLVNIKPLDPKQAPSAPVLQPSKPAKPEPQQQPAPAPPSNNVVGPQRTGTLVPAQRTGGLVPIQRTGGGLVSMPTGGFLPAQPTGFVPITAQPTGFIPIQATGILQPQLTFGIIPLQTGLTTFNIQKTGPERTNSAPPATTFGQQSTFQPTFVPLQTGNVTMPQTTFGVQVPAQLTGGLPPQTSFNQPALVPAQRTGGQITGGFVPQSNFGKQITGGFMNTNTVPMGQQITGGLPPTSFGQQITGGLPPTSFGQQITGGLPPTSFGQQITGGLPQTSFGVAPPVQQATSNPFPQPQFNQFPQQQQQQQQFNQFQPQQTFNQYQPQQQPNMNQMTNMFQNTSISSPPTFNQQMPSTSFGQPQQPQFEGFGGQPLQSQPTGMGFGNSPLATQPTGQRANINAATPDNPFGF